MNINFIIFFFLVNFFETVFASIPGTIINNNFSVHQECLNAEVTPVVQLNFAYPPVAISDDYTRISLSGLSTSGSGVIISGTGMAYLTTNTTLGSAAVLASKDRLSSQAGLGVINIFSAIFDNGTTGNTQYVGIGNGTDGFFFGYNQRSFGILYRNSGVDLWIPQSSWNADPVNTAISGTSSFNLIPQYGNIYKIQYQTLGFGLIKFYVQNPVDGSWVLVHTIQFSNIATSSPNLSNSSLQLLAVNSNNPTTSSNVSLKICCMAGMLEGYRPDAGLYNRYSIGFVEPSVTTTVRNVLSIQNNVTYAGANNQTMVFPDFLSIYNASTSRGVIVRVYLNPTVGGTPSYTNVDSNSVVSYDTAGTTISGGKEIMTIFGINSAGTNKGAITIDLSNKKIKLSPGDRLVIATRTVNSTLTNVGISLSWYEKQ